MIKRKGKILIISGIAIITLSSIFYSVFDTALETFEESKKYYENHPWERYETYPWGGTYDKMESIDNSISSAKNYIFYSKIGIIFGMAFILGGIVRYMYPRPEEKSVDLKDIENYRVCPVCGASNRNDAEYCFKCGNKI